MSDMLSIALPKGRMADDAYELFLNLGYGCDGMDPDSRKLVFENTEKGFRYLLVKPADVAVYVEYGAADIGIVGRDVLLESGADVYDLLDLNIGVCKLAVAAPEHWTDNISLPLRVATKYPAIAQNYFDSQNRQIEIIKLNGSIELAPILGLSDVIVDIVETGTTLRENNLVVKTIIDYSSASLIANKSSYRFETRFIDDIRERLKGVIT